MSTPPGQYQDTEPQQTRNAIIAVVSGLSIAAFTGALMKLLSADLSPFQIAWFRFLGLFLILLPVVTMKIGSSALKPARPGMQVIRGITMSVATVAFITGARTIDFADAIAILYAYPFLLTLIAVAFLGEKVRWVGWTGVIGGFFGVLLIMRPDFENFNTGSLFVFLCAMVISIQMAINRKLGSLSHPLVTTLWGAIVATASLSLAVPFFWNPVSVDHLWLLILMAATGAVNQTCLVYGFGRAEASTLAPFTYFEIVAAVIFGLLFFDTLPGWISWFGIALIVASGVLVAHSLGGTKATRRGAKF